MDESEPSIQSHRLKSDHARPQGRHKALTSTAPPIDPRWERRVPGSAAVNGAADGGGGGGALQNGSSSPETASSPLVNGGEEGSAQQQQVLRQLDARGVIPHQAMDDIFALIEGAQHVRRTCHVLPLNVTAACWCHTHALLESAVSREDCQRGICMKIDRVAFANEASLFCQSAAAVHLHLLLVLRAGGHAQPARQRQPHPGRNPESQGRGRCSTLCSSTDSHAHNSPCRPC